MIKILQKNEKILRKTALEVPIHEIKTTKIKKVLKEMSSALKSQEDGVAIAAPQIGHSLRIFIISGRVLKAGFAARGVSQRGGARGSAVSVDTDSDRAREDPAVKDLIFINPKIIKLSREKEWVPEGCLSVRPFYGKTRRSKKVLLAAHDENGEKFTRGASGLLAQIFQHETDHLNGILFIDQAKDVKKEIPK